MKKKRKTSWLPLIAYSLINIGLGMRSNLPNRDSIGFFFVIFGIGLLWYYYLNQSKRKNGTNKTN